MSITLESLGFTKEELQQRVIDQLCEQIITGTACDEDGEPVTIKSALGMKLEELVKKQTSESVEAMAAKYILPNVATYIENLCLTETNQWGEAKKAPVTFIEYLVQRADAYMKEEVNHQGKSRAEGDSYSWSRKSTRIAHMIHEHLHYQIEQAMKEALANANKSIAVGLHEACRHAINDVAAKFKITAKTD